MNRVKRLVGWCEKDWYKAFGHTPIGAALADVYRTKSIAKEELLSDTEVVKVEVIIREKKVNKDLLTPLDEIEKNHNITGTRDDITLHKGGK